MRSVRFMGAATIMGLMLAVPAGNSYAQTVSQDPMAQRFWDVGIGQSQVRDLAQVLMDSIGPRLAGSPNLASAQEWLIRTYESWGVPARREQYGTWEGWQQGILHVDLIAPRVQTLEAKLLAWSPPTDGPVEGDVVALPTIAAQGDLDAWLPSVAGKWVLADVPVAVCRAPQELEKWARPETVERINQERSDAVRAWRARLGEIGGRGLTARLEDAGALGVISSRWSNGWGVNKIFSASTTRTPHVDLSCEDYGLLYRLAERNQSPRVRIEAESQELGVVPQFNVIAELKGTELPDEYVLLGAHLDSWHGAAGATDNGTGTIMMLEAMRILKEVYPNPRRTILVGHWGAEEMGLIGSSSFREDHPEVMEGLQAAFNQDNGTWRIERIEGQGYLDAANHIPGWMQFVPATIRDHITLEFPGNQQNSGSDHSSFVCAGVPSFRFQSPYPEYRQYTWHTNRDTYDKIVLEDLAENATLAAMIAYQASEDPIRMGREKATLVDGRGQPRAWPTCRPPRRER